MITIVDYGAGNVASLANMLEYVGTDSRFSCDPIEIEGAPKLLLPGVGSFAFAMQILRERQLDIAIQNAVRNGTLLLGVCLGMQLLGRFSEEGNTEGLGLLEADVRKISSSNNKLKIPNMGWHEVKTSKNHWLVQGNSLPERYYFAHSYHMICDDPADVVATIEYDGTKAAAVAHGNVFGVQFHPEKSHRFGARLLSDFAGLGI